MNKVIETYARIWPFIRALPLLAALPVAVELIQHAAEIQLGFYATGGVLAPDAKVIRLSFGAAKLLAVIVAIFVALRWYGFGGDRRRVFRPSWMFGRGIASYVVIESLGEVLQTGSFHLIRAALGPSPDSGVGLYLAIASVWTFVTGLWLPWYVGMLVEDRAMTFRRSVVAVGLGVGMAFWYVFAGVAPLMALHYGFGYLSMGRSLAITWVINAADAVVVLFLAVAIASSFFTVYRWAKDRAEAAAAPAA